jgi:hypothetical protein
MDRYHKYVHTLHVHTQWLSAAIEPTNDKDENDHNETESDADRHALVGPEGADKPSRIILETKCEAARVEELDTTSGGDDWPVRLHLSNGRVYGCDFVIEAKGVVPNTDMLATCPEIEVGGGLCLPVLHTCVCDIFHVLT